MLLGRRRGGLTNRFETPRNSISGALTSAASSRRRRGARRQLTRLAVARARRVARTGFGERQVRHRRTRRRAVQRGTERAARGRSSSDGACQGFGAAAGRAHCWRAPTRSGRGCRDAADHPGPRRPGLPRRFGRRTSRDPVGQARDHREIVRDPDQCRAALAQSCCTSCRIWPWMVTSSAVVGSSAMISVRPVQQRNGDRHALAHAAGELMRIGGEPLGGRRRCRRVASASQGALAPLAAPIALMGVQGLDHLRVDAKHRIERHHRVLEDHGDPRPRKLRASRGSAAHQVFAFEQDFAGGDRGRAGRSGPGSKNRSWSCRNPTRRPGRAPRRTDAKTHAVDRAAAAPPRVANAAAQVAPRRAAASAIVAHFCSLGLRISRNWSPTRLIERW